MKKSGSVCALAIILIGSICVELKAEEYISKYGYLAIKPGSHWSEKPTPKEMVKMILNFQSFNGLPQTGISDNTTENEIIAKYNYVKGINAKKTETKWPLSSLTRRKSEHGKLSELSSDQQSRTSSQVFNRRAGVYTLIQKTRVTQPATVDYRYEHLEERGRGFCMWAYNSIDAVMSLDGTNAVFVNNGEVIDGRNGQKVAVETLFPEGPTWVQAAVYSEENLEVYLFKDDNVWVYMFHRDYSDFLHRGVFPNYNKHSHNPECAMMYLNEMFLLKNGTFFKFRPYIKNPDRHGKKTLGGFSINTTVDAAISSGDNIKFIVKDKVFKVSNKNEVKIIQTKRTNQVFDHCSGINFST